ncbi:MAG: flagellar export chaperone FlgN [Melioribacteraceae bacterium]|nr:flagellar export chaperone FlgN [Melioribacteraceae bacterium]
MMEKEIIESLGHEEKVLSELLDAAKSKQKAIVQNDYNALEEVNSQEEKLLSELDNAINKQQQIVKELYDSKSVEPDEGKKRSLSILIRQYKDLFNPDLLIKINEKRLIVREMVEHLTKLNHQNKYLIEHTSSLVKETISLLLKSRKRSLLDRRI